MEKVKIIDYSWHIGHQATLLELPNTQWTYIANNVRPNWNKSYRDLPSAAVLDYAGYYEPGKYDMAVLHIDQSSLSRDPALSRGKNVLSCDINDAIKDIPKVIINHGTPFWPEIINQETREYDKAWMLKKCKDYVGDNLMIVNSHQAKEEWGIENSRVIVHGLNPGDWYDLPKDPIVFTTLSPAGWPTYYNRMLQEEVRSTLGYKYGIKLLHVGKEYIAESFEDYKKVIGSSLIYFNPTFESPMPRARTEAMFSGACIVTTKHHDSDLYFNCNLSDLWKKVPAHMFYKLIGEVLRQGADSINGIIVPDNPDAVVDVIAWLHANYDVAVKIGQNGKAAAARMFHKERFDREWAEVIHSLTGKKIL